MHLPPHPWDGLLAQVQKPARYAGPEWGAVEPRPRAELRLALAFPDLYEVGCSNLGLAILYRKAAALPWVHVERVFAPWPDLARQIVARDLPLVTRESASPLRSFQVVGFTLQHELTYTTVLWMLSLGRIPLKAHDRAQDDPIIIAGGPCASNPEPLADFLDASVAGDGELAIGPILETVRSARARGSSRMGILTELADLGWVHVPRLWARASTAAGRRVVSGPLEAGRTGRLPVAQAPAAQLRGAPLTVPVVPATEPVFDRLNIELARGCAGGCRFCHAGIYYRPVRQRSPGEVVESIVRGVLATGWDEVGLTSLSAADYPALGRLVEALSPILTERRIALSVPSLRAWGLEGHVLEAIRRVRATGMTLAPEAGSDRLRAVINKNVTGADLISALGTLREHGWQKAKLYFMLGLPSETPEDLEALACLLADSARAWGSRRGGRRSLSASIACFIPKPFTAFERHRLLEPEAQIEAARSLRALTRGIPVELSFHDARQSWIEGILARAGAEAGPALEAALAAGCMLDGWTEHFGWDAWQGALALAGLDGKAQAGMIDGAAPLPWDVIDMHVDRSFLANEHDLAMRGVQTPPCDAPVGERCHSCGAPCDPAQAALGANGDDDGSEALGRATSILETERLLQARAWGAAGPEDRHRVVIDFDRLEPARWLGHRDVARCFAQSLRRAGVPLRYSEGFTPRPHLVFRAALPVGVVGLGESLNIETTLPLANPQEFLHRLRTCTPEGISILAVRSASIEEAKAIARGPARMAWWLVMDATVEQERVRTALESIMGATTLPARREMDDRTVEFDLRAMIAGARAGRAGDCPSLARAAIDPACIVACVEAVALDGRWMRSEEMTRLVSERGLTPVLIARELQSP